MTFDQQYRASIREEQRLYDQMVSGSLTLVTFDTHAYARASYRAFKELRLRNAMLSGEIAELKSEVLMGVRE